MCKLIKNPSIISSEGNKIIKEYIGRVNTKTEIISIAYMVAPSGWSEIGQQPDFDEYTIVIKGILQVKTKNNIYKVEAGEAIIVYKGEWVQYSTIDGAEYIAICLPAFSPELANRDIF